MLELLRSSAYTPYSDVTCACAQVTTVLHPFNAPDKRSALVSRFRRAR